MKPIRFAVAVVCMTLVCCTMDDEPLKGGASAVGSEDAGPDEGGSSGSVGPVVSGKGGASDDTKAGRGTAGISGAWATGGAPAAGSGGTPVLEAGAGAMALAGQNAGGAGGVAGAGQNAGGAGGVAGMDATAGALAAGSGGSEMAGRGPQKPDCPAAPPKDGSACKKDIQGIMCPYEGVSCRCRNSTPVWLCTATDPRANGAAGSQGPGADPSPGPGQGPR